MSNLSNFRHQESMDTPPSIASSTSSPPNDPPMNLQSQYHQDMNSQQNAYLHDQMVANARLELQAHKDAQDRARQEHLDRLVQAHHTDIGKAQHAYVAQANHLAMVQAHHKEMERIHAENNRRERMMNEAYRAQQKQAKDAEARAAVQAQAEAFAKAQAIEPAKAKAQEVATMEVELCPSQDHVKAQGPAQMPAQVSAYVVPQTDPQTLAYAQGLAQLQFQPPAQPAYALLQGPPQGPTYALAQQPFIIDPAYLQALAQAQLLPPDIYAQLQAQAAVQVNLGLGPPVAPYLHDQAQGQGYGLPQVPQAYGAQAQGAVNVSSPTDGSDLMPRLQKETYAPQAQTETQAQMQAQAQASAQMPPQAQAPAHGGIPPNKAHARTEAIGQAHTLADRDRAQIEAQARAEAQREAQAHAEAQIPAQPRAEPQQASRGTKRKIRDDEVDLRARVQAKLDEAQAEQARLDRQKAMVLAQAEAYQKEQDRLALQAEYEEMEQVRRAAEAQAELKAQEDAQASQAVAQVLAEHEAMAPPKSEAEQRAEQKAKDRAQRQAQKRAQPPGPPGPQGPPGPPGPQWIPRPPVSPRTLQAQERFARDCLLKAIELQKLLVPYAEDLHTIRHMLELKEETMNYMSLCYAADRRLTEVPTFYKYGMYFIYLTTANRGIQPIYLNHIGNIAQQRLTDIFPTEQCPKFPRMMDFVHEMREKRARYSMMNMKQRQDAATRDFETVMAEAYRFLMLHCHKYNIPPRALLFLNRFCLVYEWLGLNMLQSFEVTIVQRLQRNLPTIHHEFFRAMFHGIRHSLTNTPLPK